MACRKNGTPTMGGLTFYLGDVLGVAAGYAVLVLCAPALMGGYFSVQSITLYICILTAFAFGAVGFVDDYIKVVKSVTWACAPALKLWHR